MISLLCMPTLSVARGRLLTASVAAFAAFPHYAGLFSRSGEAVSEEAAGLPRVELVVEGMTCEACAAHVERELRGVPGVRGASVDYGAGRATVAIDPQEWPSVDALIHAVEGAGYEGRPVDAP